MPSVALEEANDERRRWKWWDQFWLSCGLTLAAVALLAEASRLFVELPNPNAQVSLQPCGAETR